MPHCLTHGKKKQLTVFVTARCNLRCRYCYPEGDKEKPQTIDIDFVKCGIRDFFFQQDSRMIRLFGVGEPTTEFELLQTTRDYAYELAGDDLSVELQTNGVFSHEVAEWIAGNVDVVWISIDGPPEINDKLRPAPEGKGLTYQILENIDYLKDKLFVGVRPTIGPENLSMLPQLVEYFGALGVKAVCPNEENIPDGTYESITSIDMMEFARQLEKAWYTAENHGLILSSNLTFNFDEETIYACRACLPVPHLTIDGYVSCCDDGQWGDSLPQDLIFGKYDPENKKITYFSDRIETLRRRHADNLVHCQDCIAKYNCAGGCLGRTAYQSGSMWGQRLDFCKAVRYLAARLPRNTKNGTVFHP